MILFNPTSSYLWLNKNFLSSQGTEVNKNSTSYTSVLSPQKKKKEKKEKKNKERVWGQTSVHYFCVVFAKLKVKNCTCTDLRAFLEVYYFHLISIDLSLS